MHLFDLHGKVALVTGAGRGLGRGMALALAEAGADVVAVSRSVGQLEETQEQLREYGGNPGIIPWNLSDSQGLDDLVARVIERYGHIDVLLHAAGVQVRKPALEVDLEDWESVQAVHLRATFFLSQAVARRMIERGTGGKIILVSSVTSHIGVANLAGATVFLASSASDYVTGQVINVDGGWLAA